MKTKEEIMMEHCSDNGLLNMRMGKHILSAMEEYARQFTARHPKEDAAKLRELADWFDVFDEQSGNTQYGHDEVQVDLRRIADEMETVPTLPSDEEMMQKAHDFLESIHVPHDAIWGHCDIDKMMVEFAKQWLRSQMGEGKNTEGGK